VWVALSASVPLKIERVKCVCVCVNVVLYIYEQNDRRSRVSSVSIVSDYGLDDRAIEVRSPAGAKGFFL
jgi:hypothetical protein